MEKSSWYELLNIPNLSLQGSETPIPNVCPGYVTKLSDHEVSVLELWEISFIAISHRFTLTWSGSTC